MKPTDSPATRRSARSPDARSLAWKLVALLLGSALPTLSAADTSILAPGAAIGRQNVPPGTSEPSMLGPFKYIPPTSSSGVAPSAQGEAERPKRSPKLQRILDLSAAGDYKAISAEGMTLLANEKQDDELQLIVANSLAWTGRLKEAVPAYQGLLTGRYANEASVGLASVYRWSGRDERAITLYRSVLANDPTHAGALEGLNLATRETSPRTLLSFGRSSDSSDEQRHSATLNHRWRDKSGAHQFEVETSRVQDALPSIEAQQQDVSFRYQNLNLALKPSLELSIPTTNDHTLYASARVKLFSDQVTLSGGRVNWSRMANNPNALTRELSAMHAGIGFARDFSFGNLSARANFYDVSDSNLVAAASVHLASTWRPLGSSFKPFIGVETRGAKFSATSYWSPDQGSGTLYAGLLADWGSTDWSFFGSAQVGTRLFGDAGASWSLSTGGKLWVTNDIALSANVWSMSSWRNNAAYRAQAATLNLEKLWR